MADSIDCIKDVSPPRRRRHRFDASCETGRSKPILVAKVVSSTPRENATVPHVFSMPLKHVSQPVTTGDTLGGVPWRSAFLLMDYVLNLVLTQSADAHSPISMLELGCGVTTAAVPLSILAKHSQDIHFYATDYGTEVLKTCAENIQGDPTMKR